jgi:AraC-like DNA-binding protein
MQDKLEKTKMEKPDALTDVLDMLKPRGHALCYSEMSAPWAISLPTDGYARFHVIEVIEHSAAWLRVEGARELTPLASGDLVIVPHGHGHVLADCPKTEPVLIDRLIKGKADSANLLQHGGGGAQTLMACGSFQFVNGDYNPLLAVLPPLIHIPSGREQLDEWLEPTLKMLAYEAGRPRPGSETLVARLIDIILVQAVRVWFEERSHDRGGWLGALRDPQIGAAIGLIHREPQRNWSVSALAREVAMSRSIFAAKFSSLVGEPPLTYLTRWRLWQASRLLAEGNLSVGETALRVGYESEAAFSKAFKRHFGQSPLAYRRGQVQAD